MGPALWIFKLVDVSMAFVSRPAWIYCGIECNPCLYCLSFLLPGPYRNTLPAAACCKSHRDNLSKYKLSLFCFQMIIVERFEK